MTFPPSALHPSPELAAIPMLGEVATHFAASKKPEHKDAAIEVAGDLAALHASLDANGIIEPLKVTLSKDRSTGVIWDGRHRHQWATHAGLSAVPIVEVSEDAGRALIAATVVGRRHWTKGQRAWLAVILHPYLAGGTRGRKYALSAQLTAAEVADLYGVSLRLIVQAIEIAKAFDRLPTLRDRHEPGIWAGFGLGAILAGIPGAQTTVGQPRKASTWINLTKPYGTLTTLGKAYASWPEADQQAAQEATVRWLANECDPAFRTMLAESLAAVAP